MTSRTGGLFAALALAAVAALSGSGLAQTPAPAPAPAAAPPTGAARPIPPAELEAFIDGLAADAMARDHIAGAAVSIVQDGQVVLQKGYGVDRLAPTRPVDPARTLFRVGGVGATFTWIALMREIEAGHIRLDAPVNVYLPEKNQVKDQGYKRPILVRDLLGQTAGFEERQLGQLAERSPERIRPLEVYLRQERARRVREPGAAPSVSLYGAALAGEALTWISSGRQPTQALVEAQILRPLGLSRTTLREPYPARPELPLPMDPALAADVSDGFRWTGSGFKARPFEFMTQAGPAMAASATAADMGRYMNAILGDGSFGGASIYSPSLARAFRTRTPGGAAPVGLDHGFMEYALGGERTGYGQDGSTLSFRSRLLTVPELKLGIFVTANTESAGPFVAELPLKVIQHFYGSPSPVIPAGSAWLRQNAAVFSGDYLTTRRAYHGLEAFVDLLHAGSRVQVTNDGVLLTPGPAGVQRWLAPDDASLEAPFLSFTSADGPGALVFELKAGQASRYFAPNGEATFERSGPLSMPWMLALMAAATAVAGLAAIAGLFLRDRREFRQTSVQGRADAAQISASVLWLVAIACFFGWRSGAGDAALLMYDWPGAWLLIGSGCAFVAAVMTAICLGLAPVAWRGGRRLDSWTIGRKARFTCTTVVFTLFAALLVLWGALPPWGR